jgi:hypothetical protein
MYYEHKTGLEYPCVMKLHTCTFQLEHTIKYKYIVEYAV